MPSRPPPSRVGEGGEGELVPLLRLRLADVLLVIIDVVRGRGDAGRQGYLCGRGRAGWASVWENGRREIRWRERDSCATDRRRGGYPRAIRRRRCLGAVRRPSQSRPSRSSRLSPVCSGVRRPASSKTRLRFAANRRQRRTIVYEVIPEPPSRARRHSVAREPRRSSRPDVRRAFNPRVSSISAPAHRTHQVRR